MIEKLVSRPHEHITLHLAMWTQSGVSYILFPLAKYNLREFMGSTPDRPRLTAPFVLWFLVQLRGLASALSHIHFIGQESSPDDTAVTESGDYGLLGADLTDETQSLGLAGFHHDIKSDNILVFEKETTRPGCGGTLKITDFGAGRFADLRLGQQSSGVKAAKGTLTYKAPDKYPSRPFDIWALGCVFIELLIWALTPEQDGGRGFSSRRGWMADHPPGIHEPTYPDDAFWFLDPISNEIKLRHAVQMQLDDLMNKYSRGMNAFEKVTKLTQDLFTIDPLLRPNAAQVVARLTDILQKVRAEFQDDSDRYLQDPNRRLESRSAPSESVFNVRLAEIANARPPEFSPTDQDMRHTYDSEESPEPFLRREEIGTLAEESYPSTHSIDISDPDPAIYGGDIDPVADGETMERNRPRRMVGELADENARPRTELKALQNDRVAVPDVDEMLSGLVMTQKERQEGTDELRRKKSELEVETQRLE